MELLYTLDHIILQPNQLLTFRAELKHFANIKIVTSVHTMDNKLMANKATE